MPNTIPLEVHPFEPFVPTDARVLMLGTFPPKPQRWSMPFYYPNKINDMWRVMGLVFRRFFPFSFSCSIDCRLISFLFIFLIE